MTCVFIVHPSARSPWATAAEQRRRGRVRPRAPGAHPLGAPVLPPRPRGPPFRAESPLFAAELQRRTISQAGLPLASFQRPEAPFPTSPPTAGRARPAPLAGPPKSSLVEGVWRPCVMTITLFSASEFSLVS